MQSVSTDFTDRTGAVIRPISWRVLISWAKNFDAGIDFFTIGSSSIGGGDILKGDENVLQEWDKYDYEDYSDRILSVEINRQTDPPTNPISMATATIVLDNHDDLFTPGAGGALDAFLLSRRPIRINLGFGGETIPKFVGITDSKPQIDERSKTVKLTCIDFMNAIMNITLDEEVMFVDYRTDQAISALLETGGLLTSQFSLDTGTVIIPFIYFKKGSRLGDGLRDIAQAELGNVSMKENGMIRFVNRENWAQNASVWNLNKENVIEKSTVSSDKVINVVEVYSRAREVQAKQKLWEAASAIELAPGVSTEIFIDFKDDYGALPVTAADDPVYITSATTSLFATNLQRDGSGNTMNSSVSLVSSDLFSTAMKLTFSNSSAFTIFLTQLEIYATPAKVVNDLYIRVTDPNSIGIKDGYEEHPIKIENDLIQDAVAANSIGQIVIEDRAEDDDQQQFIIKSIPQLQLGDVVTYSDENIVGETYFVTRIDDIINLSGYRQLVQGSKRTINEYFKIGISSLGGSDKLAP